MKPKSWLPLPNLSLFLLVTWLLLVNSISVMSVFFAVIIAVAMPLVVRSFWPEMPKVRSRWKLLRFVGILLVDIVRSNITTSFLIMRSNRHLRPAWIILPLDLQDPFAVTILANTISLTPGTVTVEVGKGHNRLLIHSLHAPDPEAALRFMKERYEQPLLEIFR